MSFTPADIEACADHLGNLALKAEAFEREVNSETEDEIAAIAKNAAKWVGDEVADPTEELASIYRQAAQYWDSPEQIGYYVKTFLDGKITGVLEARLSK